MKYKALVDDEDFEFLSRYKWRVHHDESRMYVKCKINGKSVSMHILLLGKKDGLVIDHMDGNGLNNQRSNLRFCTTRENNLNSSSKGVCKYIGVSPNITKNNNFSKKLNKFVITGISISWRARLTIGNKNTCIGCFKTPEEAAVAYDKMAKIHYGEFARLNFPD